MSGGAGARSEGASTERAGHDGFERRVSERSRGPFGLGSTAEQAKNRRSAPRHRRLSGACPLEAGDNSGDFRMAGLNRALEVVTLLGPRRTSSPDGFFWASNSPLGDLPPKVLIV